VRIALAQRTLTTQCRNRLPNVEGRAPSAAECDCPRRAPPCADSQLTKLQRLMFGSVAVVLVGLLAVRGSSRWFPDLPSLAANKKGTIRNPH